MTEEEKKAIKSMKRFVECRQDMTAVTASEMKTVLNLLEKKDKEIQFQKDINKTEQDRNKQTEKSLKGQIIKQNKIIELMAIAIGDEPLPIEEYCVFRNYDCPVVGGNRDCKECVKQYFERKVENGNYTEADYNKEYLP